MATYDISNDRLRLQMEKLLRDNGLRRVQYSVFRGKIPSVNLEKIKKGCLNIFADSRGKANAQVYPLFKKSLSKAVLITVDSIEQIRDQENSDDVIVI